MTIGPVEIGQRRVWLVARAMHRIALVAYPPSFRREFRDDLERIFDRRWCHAASRGLLPAIWLAIFQILDALGSGLAERARSLHVRWAWPRDHDAIHDIRKPSMTWDTLSADFRLASRQLRRAPVFTILTALTLALGIGVNSAIFGVVHAVLLRPLPYANPGALVALWSDNMKQGEPHNPVSPANFEAFRGAPAFADVEALYSFLAPAQIRLGGDPELVHVSTVTPGMFGLLGREAVIGRVFGDGDADNSVVLSHQYWLRRFGGDVNVIGRAVEVVGIPEPSIVLGVMPPDFQFPYRSMLGPSGFTRAQHADAWVPLSRRRDPRVVDATGAPNRNIHYFAVIGRLRPRLTIHDARSQLQEIARQRAVDFPDTNAGWGVTVRPLHDQTVGVIRPALLTLAAGVGVVLLITCINVANVLLARATGRQRDVAIRWALGASRRRLLQQMMVESTMLSIIGGAIGVTLAMFGMQAILAMAPPTLPRITEVGVSLAVTMFAAVVSVGTGMVVGLIPAISAARAQSQEALREARRSTATMATQRIRSALIIAEVSLAMALTIGAGLLLRSFVTVLGVDPGFQSDRLLTFQIGVPARYADAQSRVAFYDDLEPRLKAIPGVVAVGGTTRLPLGSTNVTTMIEVEGRATPRAEWPEVELRRSVFDFFDAMQIPRLRGRTFTRADALGAPGVAVVNGAFAARVFPNEDPLNKRVRIGASPNQPWLTIVGVVGSVKHGSLEETPRPELYIQYRQGPPVSPFLVVRTSGDPAAVATAVREALRNAGADPPFELRTMEAIRSASVGERRFVLALVAIFGALALALAAVGVYGVIALVSAERTAEVGIRLALGAAPVDVLRLVVGHAVKLAAIGVAIGAGIALAIAPALGSQLFGIGGRDPLTYAGVAAVLIAIAAGAALAPARRAMRVDPASSLRV